MENPAWGTPPSQPLSDKLWAISMLLTKWIISGAGLVVAALFAVRAAGAHSSEEALKAVATVVVTVILLALLNRIYAAPEHDSSTSKGMFIGGVIGLAVPAIVVYVLIHDIF